MGTLKNRRIAERADVAQIAAQLSLLLSEAATDGGEHAAELAQYLVNHVSTDTIDEYAEILVRSCAWFFDSGLSKLGVAIGKLTLNRALSLENIRVQRRMANILGAQYCDIADFASAMAYLETAIVLARKIGDTTIEAACLANVIAVLQEMGHYRQAIAMSERVLSLVDDSHLANMLKLQCMSNGLFAAHRISNANAAAKFLHEGQKYISLKADPLRRAFFERGRVLYLVDLGHAELAQSHLDETLASIGTTHSPRIRTLLTIAAAVCEWGRGCKRSAREHLEVLRTESKVTRLYHHFVLQALVKTYSDADTPVEAEVGLAHARELVEYTTSVKKAKFYRQLASKREEAGSRLTSDMSNTAVDAFGSARDWLSASEVVGPVAESGTGERRVLTKHEELTVIHEDMAKLRVASLRREIRTDAVDTAENWAIAAEFFDDETGQHCYRVGHLASMLAREIGMNDAFCIQVEHAARLHDIGKIAVNEVILLKPGPLDAAEMAAMRLHTEVGAQILSGSDDPTLKMAVDVARHHHEWWNGGGYPAKISGKAIPLSARVSAFADVYDALTHARAYKKAWSHERALEEIERLTGTQFDPDLIAPFRAVLRHYVSDLAAKAIPAFTDMNSNALIASRRKLMETIDGKAR